jgi:cytidyltransferase-like protein
VVVFGGGFQPFHPGHLSSYLQAKQAFPNAKMYVAASNDTKTRPIPFDGKRFLAAQAGVVDPFVEVKTPITPREILAQYNPNSDVYILVRSERDPMNYTKDDGSPDYTQPFVGIDQCQPFAKHGYVFVTKKADFAVNGQTACSGSDIRSMYSAADDGGRTKIIAQLYPKSKKQNDIRRVLDYYLAGQVTEADRPEFSSIGTASPIPGTPADLQPQPSDEEVAAYRREMADMQRFLNK